MRVNRQVSWIDVSENDPIESLICRGVHTIEVHTSRGLTKPPVVLQRFIAAEMLVATLAGERLVVHK